MSFIDDSQQDISTTAPPVSPPSPDFAQPDVLPPSDSPTPPPSAVLPPSDSPTPPPSAVLPQPEDMLPPSDSSYLPPSSPPHHYGRILSIIGGSLILLLIAGGVVYAYVENIGIFSNPPYTQNNLLMGLVKKAATIKSSTQLVSVSLATEPRAKDAKPFNYQPQNQAALLARYARDATRVQDVHNILLVLKLLVLKYNYSPSYPHTLSGVKSLDAAAASYGSASSPLSITDPLTQKPYEYHTTDNGHNFALSVTFETPDAIRKIKQMSGEFVGVNKNLIKATSIQGQTVTFTKKSNSYFYFSATPPKPFFVQLQNSLSYLPSQFNVIGSLQATSNWTQKKNISWKSNINLTGAIADSTYKFNMEMLEKDGLYYVRINKIPGLFGSLSSYKGVWIKIDPHASSTQQYAQAQGLNYLASTASSTGADYKKNWIALTKALTEIATIADQTNLLTFSGPPKAVHINGRLLYRYDLQFNKDAIMPFYKQLLAQAKKDPSIWKNFHFDQGFLNSLQGSQFNAVFSYYQKNTTLALFVDPKGFPAIVDYSIRIVPSDTATALKGKQVELHLRFELSGINQPVVIQAPSSTKTLQELEQTTYSYGNSRASNAKMISDLSVIRTQAALYYGDHKSYGTPEHSCSTSNNLFSDQTIANAIYGIQAAAKEHSVVCNNTRTAYAVEAKSPLSSGATYWCIDSTGVSEQANTPLGISTHCSQ